jgi:hypothetical protein
LRQLNSEEIHDRFPAPRERDDDVVSIGRDRESCVYRPCRGWPSAAAARPGAGVREMTLSADHTQYCYRIHPPEILQGTTAPPT